MPPLKRKAPLAVRGRRHARPAPEAPPPGPYAVWQLQGDTYVAVAWGVSQDAAVRLGCALKAGVKVTLCTVPATPRPYLD